MSFKTPQYIKGLLKQNGSAKQGRKVWGIDLETIWLPFFTATNLQGDTAIPSEDLGQPLRLALAKDGSPKFSTSGKPQIRVASEVSNQVKLVKQNFEATLSGYTNSVFKDNPEGYKAEVDKNIKAGKPIADREQALLNEAYEARRQAEIAEAIAQASQPAEASQTPEAEAVGVTS